MAVEADIGDAEPSLPTSMLLRFWADRERPRGTGDGTDIVAATLSIEARLNCSWGGPRKLVATIHEEGGCAKSCA